MTELNNEWSKFYFRHFYSVFSSGPQVIAYFCLMIIFCFAIFFMNRKSY